MDPLITFIGLAMASLLICQGIAYWCPMGLLWRPYIFPDDFQGFPMDALWDDFGFLKWSLRIMNGFPMDSL